MGGAGGNQIVNNSAYNAGHGGAGILFRDGQAASLTNAGTVAGGNGGTAVSGANFGIGGAGIVGAASGNITIINSGTIRGGLAGDGTTRADAVSLAGSNNRFEIRAGSSTVGNVVVAPGGSNNVLALGGTSSGTFDVTNVVNSASAGATDQYVGFSNFEKTGSSTWTLTGTGNQEWLILEGVLSGNATSMSGNLTFAVGAGSRTVEFDQTVDGTYSGSISGDGGLTKLGGGTLTLSGVNTYTGITTIEAGTLQIGNGSTTGTLGSGAVVNNGVLAFNRFDSLTVGNNISGNGTLIKTGRGSLNLTGNNSFSGTTRVDGGLLSVNGSLANSPVHVGRRGRLGGTGTVGGITNAGTVAPGNSIGTLNVAGNVVFSPNSIYEVEINADGRSDRIVARGTATIQRGARVAVLAEEGRYAPSTTYTILTARGGVKGRFSQVTSNYAFLDPSLSYGANRVTLTLEHNDQSFASVGLTPNQIATAAAVESIGAGSSLFDAVVQLDANNARGAFDSLSGEIHGSTASTLVETSRFVRDAVIDRLVRGTPAQVLAAFTADLPAASAPTPVPVPPALAPAWGFWGEGFGSWGKTERTPNTAKADRSTGGFLLGLDGGVGDTWRLGFAGGYSSTNLDATGRLSSATIDSYHAAIYGGTRLGAFALRLGGAYAWNDIDTTRVVAFPGFADSLRADYKARTGQIFGEVAYGFGLGAVNVEPFAGLAYVHIDTDRFREIGGAAALWGHSGSQGITYSTLGLRFATTFAVSEATALTARGTIGWRHAFDELGPVARLVFDGSTPFAVSGAPIAENALVLDAELGMNVGTNASLGIAYSGQIAQDVQDHGLKGTFTLRF